MQKRTIIKSRNYGNTFAANKLFVKEKFEQDKLRFITGVGFPGQAAINQDGVKIYYDGIKGFVFVPGTTLSKVINQVSGEMNFGSSIRFSDRLPDEFWKRVFFLLKREMEYLESEKLLINEQ